ncbi:PHB depolymerase family esterase [Herbaspirillum sp. YR522]|uniref:alpha/beta hydrolase family esterase n=1 Tax=Herbaspirillum sp. YR522 TaxID=1144342 RepID=UPI001EE66AB3|nr:PHB depolymerase family esterase [Herbaspirillum sp. YR522]
MASRHASGGPSRLLRVMLGAALLCGVGVLQAADLSLKTMPVGHLSRAYFSERAAHPTPLPLIIALHGGGSNGSMLARATGLAEIGEAAGYMVVFPNGTGPAIDARTWNSGGCCGYAQLHKVDDVAFLRALIDKLVADGQVDRSRVFITGLSNGGMMAYRMAAEAPELFKAVAVVSAVLDTPPESIVKGVPVIHIHGSDDPFIPFLGGVGPREATQTPRLSVARTVEAWVKANGADPRPELTESADDAGDGTSVRRYTYHNKTDAQAVVLVEIKGGGHNWPGTTAPMVNAGRASRNLNASRTIVEFFDLHGGAAPDNPPGHPPGDTDGLPPGATPLPRTTAPVAPGAPPAPR